MKEEKESSRKRNIHSVLVGKKEIQINYAFIWIFFYFSTHAFSGFYVSETNEPSKKCNVDSAVVVDKKEFDILHLY